MVLAACLTLGALGCEAGTAGSGPALERTTWNIVTVGGQTPGSFSEQIVPHILLEPAEHRVTGFAGCNTFFGAYKLDGDQLSFGPVGATRKACPDATNREISVLEAIDATTHYRVEDDHLILMAGERPLMKLAVAPAG